VPIAKGIRLTWSRLSQVPKLSALPLRLLDDVKPKSTATANGGRCRHECTNFTASTPRELFSPVAVVSDGSRFLLPLPASGASAAYLDVVIKLGNAAEAAMTTPHSLAKKAILYN
jgi:hypothetical protein